MAEHIPEWSRSRFRMTPVLPRVFSCLLALLLSATTWSAGAHAQDGQFLLITDLHFDPFFDAELFPRLAAAPAEEWAEILESGQPLVLNPIGTDSNYALLKSSLDDARRRLPRPDFILYPGDFIAHSWQSKYDRLAPSSRAKEPAAYQAFTAKAVQFVGHEFGKRWTQTPILPTLGNDDSYCGDYMIEPAGPFLRMFAEFWPPLLGSTAGTDAEREEFAKSFTAGGYYTVRLPKLAHHRLVVLNSVFFSTQYDNPCGQPTQTPVDDQFAWLNETLDRAAAAGEKVWLLMHIPPGIDGYTSALNEPKQDPPATFWQPAITSRFLRLIEQRRETIQMSFVGHTHMDDFRVIQLNGQPALLSKIAPAVSPIFGNNPGYQVYQHDRASGRLLDYQTYYLSNLGDKKQPTPLADARWKLEYAFRAAYDLPDVSAASVARLVGGIQGNRAIADSYTRFYTVGAKPAFGPETIEAFSCAILNTTPGEYQRCYTDIADFIRREFSGLQPAE
jgi:sphingomyelin phosphodiesterase acid-like 3